MCWKNTTERWGGVAQIFHWLIAILIIGLATVGVWMSDLPPDDTKWFVYGWHKQMGLLIFILVVLRVTWRITQMQPTLPNSMPRWQKIASHITIGVLYVVMIGFPVSGFLMSTYGGHSVNFFNIYTFEAFAQGPNEFAKTMRELHGFCLNLLIVFGTLHVLAGLYHHFILKDDVLKRMLPGAPKKS